VVPTLREQGRWEWARALTARLWPALGWVLVLVLGAVLIDFIDRCLDPTRGMLPGPLRNLIEPTNALETIVQVVPAIVIAIFVFAAGTLFVVAQVVPQARGTRAVEVLRNRHLGWTISPALALTPLTIVVLVLEPRLAWPLALALLLGAVAYLLLSTGFLLSILGEATNPLLYAVLANSQDAAVAVLHADSYPGPVPKKRRGVGYAWRKWQIKRRRNRGDPHQAAVDELYGVVRTLRGWTRSAATAGDSRELQVALEGTLDLVDSYTIIPVGERLHVPWEYDHNAESPETSPRVAEGSRVRETPDDDLKRWAFWVPPPCPQPKGDWHGRAEGPKFSGQRCVGASMGRQRGRPFIGAGRRVRDHIQGSA
jgi:hypothetical protein